MLIVGGAKDMTFELLLMSVAEWFINNPTPTWRHDLIMASRTVDQQCYYY